MGSRIKIINGKKYDFGTRNTSFRQFAKDLKTIGVRNYYFSLEIIDLSLLNVDPYAVDKEGRSLINEDQAEHIAAEIHRNPWYYLREIARIPSIGNPKGDPYKANRGNIAQAWCILHGIDSWLCLPRQQGKTQSAIALLNWAYSYKTTNATIISVNKQVPDAKANLKRMKDQVDLLPPYLQYKSYMDEDGKVVKAIDNATRIQNPVTKTEVIIKAGSVSEEAAMSLARGLTSPILHFDEVEFTNNIDVVVDNSSSTYDTASTVAKRNGAMYCRIFTSMLASL